MLSAEVDFRCHPWSLPRRNNVNPAPVSAPWVSSTRATDSVLVRLE
jgi:hypothetical protein